MAEAFGAIDVHKHLQRKKADDPRKHFTNHFDIRFTLDAAAFPRPDQGKPQAEVYAAPVSRDKRSPPVRTEKRLHDRKPLQPPEPVLKTRDVYELREADFQMEISIYCRKPVAGLVISGDIPGYTCIRQGESTGLRVLACIINVRSNALSALSAEPPPMLLRLHHEMPVHEITSPLASPLYPASFAISECAAASLSFDTHNDFCS